MSINFSSWELWPGTTGHAPTFDNLTRLAELYECAVGDLLVDLSDFRHLDTFSDSSLQAVLPAERRLGSEPGVSAQPEQDEWGVLTPLVLSRAADPLVQRLQEIDFTGIGTGGCGVDTAHRSISEPP